VEVEVDWVGYELHPRTPPGGVPLAEVLGAPDEMLRYVRSFAAGFGISDLAPPLRLAPTRRAHAVAQHARDEGRLAQYRASAFDAYWRRRRGLESDEDLASLAAEAGLEPARALAAAQDPAMLRRVDGARRAALEAGVSGVPTFDIGATRIVGCQRYDVIAEAARRAGARRRG
jgi:predicted DsbA family dithiol-disulfide isomerase